MPIPPVDESIGYLGTFFIVETLVKKGTISEDILRQELDKVIDFGWSCVEGFAKLGYPVKQTVTMIKAGRSN